MAPELPPKEDIAISGKEDLYTIFTAVAANKLPSWTAANSDRYSLLQQFLNHGIMNQVDEANEDIVAAINNSYLNTADEDLVWNTFRIHASDINPKATDLFFTTTVCAEVKKYGIQNCKQIHFKSAIDTTTQQKLEEQFAFTMDDSHFLYKGKKLEVTDSPYSFARSFKSDKELVYYDRDTGYIHFLQPYNYEDMELIDTAQGLIYELGHPLLSHHVWNTFDEEALMHNLRRLPEESNTSLKERVNDKAINPADSTYSGLKKQLERSLGVNVDKYITARKLGLDDKEVNIHSLSDDQYIESLTKPNSMATNSLKNIADSVNDKVNIFWDDVIWDEGYWDISDNQSFRFIPFPTDI